MFLRIRRGAVGVEIEVHETTDTSLFRIDIDADVPPADATRVLFESGAAIQQADDAFLLSREWLGRYGVDVADTGALVHGADAYRATVTRSQST